MKSFLTEKCVYLCSKATENLSFVWIGPDSWSRVSQHTYDFKDIQRLL